MTAFWVTSAGRFCPDGPLGTRFLLSEAFASIMALVGIGLGLLGGFSTSRI
jgi:hypothetical protein